MTGTAQMGTPRPVRLRCGHEVLYRAPQPMRGERITCGVCGKATTVIRTPRRWKP